MVEVPPVPLDRASVTPLAVQLADGVREAAVRGALRPGDRLPSTRAMAAELGVSRTVTAAAYDQLLAEGWVRGRTGAGTFVTAAPTAGSRPPPVRTAAPGEDGERPALSLAAGRPCVDVLDPAAWRRAWRAAADPPVDDEPVPAGSPAFRAAVAEHLLRHRGLPAGAPDLLATAGSSAAVAELGRVLGPGALVAVEEPGYVRAVTALRAAGCDVVGVPVDEAGMDVDAIPDGCVAVYCTPAHQFPLGSRLAASRRVALVERARAENLLVIEDDYDGELRYDVAPLPLLASLAPEVVVHLGTASKILSQTVGAGWMVAPPAIRDAMLDLRSRTGTRPSPAGQRVFAAFAAHGDLARHLRRLRREMRARRDLLREAVEPTGWSVTGEAAGAHVVLRPPVDAPDLERQVVTELGARGVHAVGLADHLHSGGWHRPGLVVGYAAHTRDGLTVALGHLAATLTATR
ncbi:PLP-dependent aminotransferase family protein [Pseudonocardia endophytica]|uniref:GntR family transcriptional regulator/MocR family aminotransferase n=1 Tax=Pseudonocardia endophytica TaxID=401976 RepID=A0A4R1HSA7_PSEEN|nr:PLP-dependent aminotransferase family protein [Pseudonocardia endophytica]TCK25517.1 GntR family transcriptional regulator/MocR family aminotransferase [Pseudonocardia endophytica]